MLTLENNLTLKKQPLNYLESKVVLNGGYSMPEYNLYIDEVGMWTKGNFSVITGKAKSRKSTLLSLIMSSFLTTNTIFNKFRADFDGRVILIDTEQSKFHIHRLVYYSCLLSGQKDHPQGFEVYALRPYTPFERVEIIEDILSQNNNINLVVIDGIRDLVRDINSADEATEISTKLMKWTADYNCHISTVLHQNKGDSSARGHLGTELVNKAETVISVEKDENTSLVQCTQTRGLEFNPFIFGFSETNSLFVDYHKPKSEF